MNSPLRSFLPLASGLLLLVSALRAEPTFFQARVAPILDRHCVSCHGPEKRKGGLRVDTLENLRRGGDSGPAIVAGDAKKSDLHRRILLPESDDEAMPAEGKPRLTADEIKILELWIAGGASGSAALADFPGAPVPPRPRPAYVPLTPDWRPRAAEIAALEQALGVRLAPRSTEPRDGLVLRTASAPSRCNDEVLAKLAPVAEFIVEAELARTKVTDTGVAALARYANLRALDLTRTAVSSAGLKALTGLKHLESINLTATKVDAAGLLALKASPGLKRIWAYGTPAEPEPDSKPEPKAPAPATK